MGYPNRKDSIKRLREIPLAIRIYNKRIKENKKRKKDVENEEINKS